MSCLVGLTPAAEQIKAFVSLASPDHPITGTPAYLAARNMLKLYGEGINEAISKAEESEDLKKRLFAVNMNFAGSLTACANELIIQYFEYLDVSTPLLDGFDLDEWLKVDEEGMLAF